MIYISSSRATVYVLLHLLLFQDATAFLIPNLSSIRPSYYYKSTATWTSQLQASLQSNLESICDGRYDEYYKYVQWVDPASFDEQSNDEARQDLPLYPLSAVYLPVPGVKYTFNNVQPKNIQMALDLQQSQDKSFVVSLGASDTSRIATIGTRMKITDLDIQEVDGAIRRIVVTCEANELVVIRSIVNPEAAKMEYRLVNPNEYLRCAVDPYTSENETKIDSDVAQSLLDEYKKVREFYVAGYANEILPHFTFETLEEDLPSIGDFEFWSFALNWQTLCSTVRTGCQLNLDSNRNELMISAAMKKGGPLKLPIHLEDLEKSDRQEIQNMEVEAQLDWLELGLDPCLDFQALISQPTATLRAQFLLSLVTRERQRLERAALTPLSGY